MGNREREYPSVILENARLTTQRVRTRLRLPLIPGYNDSEKNLRDLISFATKIKVEKISIVPYHEWGKSKYKHPSRRYTLKVQPPGEEYIRTLQKLIKNNGPRVTVGL